MFHTPRNITTFESGGIVGNMKAQISFVEFLVAFSIFASFVAFFSFKMISHVPPYINEIKLEELRGEAYKISEILVNDVGEPENWDSLPADQIKRIGLCDGSTNSVSVKKIFKMDQLCSSPALIKEKLGVEEDFRIVIVSGDTTLLNCSSGEGMKRAAITRVFYLNDGRYGRMEVEVW